MTGRTRVRDGHSQEGEEKKTLNQVSRRSERVGMGKRYGRYNPQKKASQRYSQPRSLGGG